MAARITRSLTWSSQPLLSTHYLPRCCASCLPSPRPSPALGQGCRSFSSTAIVFDNSGKPGEPVEKMDGPGHEPRFQYDWIDGAEHLEMYSPGGYHPIALGDVLRDRYRIVDKLGYGGYSTVWLARDMHTQPQRLVAVKVGTPESSSREMTILRSLASDPDPSASSAAPSPGHFLLAGRAAMPTLLDEFQLVGPNGTHPCLVTPPAQCDLQEALSSGMFSQEVARALSAGLVLAIAYFHSKGFVHGDIHLRNVFSKLPRNLDNMSTDDFEKQFGKPVKVPLTRSDGGPLPPNAPVEAVLPIWLGKYAKAFELSDAKVMLGDFGEAFSLGETRLAGDCHTPLASRPPEAHLDPRAPLGASADIWSLAIAIWDILGMKTMFTNAFADADDVIADMVDVLGPLPRDWHWLKQDDFFDSDGQRRIKINILPHFRQHFNDRVQDYRRTRGVGVFSEAETSAILDLLRGMLQYRPSGRLSISEVLESDWMVKWALPDFRRIPKD